MHADILKERYAQLRDELDDAYAAPVWDTDRIDHIADQMAPVEAALGAIEAGAGACGNHFYE